MLTRFLRDRRPVSVQEVAELVGWSRAEVQRQALADEVLLRGEMVPWSAAVGWLLDSWPLRVLMETLGRDVTLLPRGLQLLSVQWELPAYIVNWLRCQSQLEDLPHRVIRPTEFTDYLWDFLHRMLDTDVAELLKDDRDFTAAYHFPYGGDDE
ncbi:MAG: hypothetical protein QOK37_310 [Thermoanaerobaculia bacterium]|jgi:hypothetical protein|nr:hypothetical protein [Thermoanaerobaculia bacterium]